MTITSSRNIEILNALRADKSAGFRMLFDVYYIPLCLFSLQMSDDFGAAEDIVQNFFVDFWENDLHKKITTNLHSYMFSAIRNNTLLFMRHDGNLNLVHIGNLELDDKLFGSLICEECSEEEMMEREDRLYEAMNALSPQEKESICQIVINKNSYKEASRNIGISINTLKTHLHRAMKKLRAGDAGNLLLLYFLFR